MVDSREGRAMKGEVVYLFAFDVAQEIVTRDVQEVLAAKPFPFAPRLDHTFPKDVPVYQPLAIERERAVGSLGGKPVRCLIRIYEVGAVTVCMRVNFERDELFALAPFHDPVLDDGRALDRAAGDLCGEVCASLA